MADNKKAKGGSGAKNVKNAKNAKNAAAQAEKKKNLALIIGIPALVAVVAAVAIIIGVSAHKKHQTSLTSSDGTETTSAAGDVAEVDADEPLDENLTYYARIDVVDYGTIVFRFRPDVAPGTCANFISLARSGFYDGLTFHRIMEGFMIQGGDPNGNGTGGSGKEIVGEFAANGHPNDLEHVRGTVSMARATPYDSASSQFFIVQQDARSSLDGLYAAFGTVTEGMEVVDKICADSQPIDRNGTIPASEQPVIEKITIYTEE